jgi:hypothetical protein
MKAHKEILEISTEGTIYKHKRDGYKSTEIDDLIKKLEAHDFKVTIVVAEPEKENPEEPKKSKKERKQEEKEKRKKEGEVLVKPPTKPVEEKKEVLNRKVITKIQKMEGFKEEGVQRLLNLNLRMFRLVPTAFWFPLLGVKKKQMEYASYFSPVQQCSEACQDWMNTIAFVKSSESKSTRLRSLETFLKYLIELGVRDKHVIDQWDILRTLALSKKIPEPRDDKDDRRDKIAKRTYEMLDVLYIHKSNVGYAADIQVNIRKKMQGFMIHLLNHNMKMFKSSTKSRDTIDELLKDLETSGKCSNKLSKGDHIKLNKRLKELKHYKLMNTCNPLYSSQSIQMKIKEYDLLLQFDSTCSSEISLEQLNGELQKLGVKQIYSEMSSEELKKSTDVLSQVIERFFKTVKKEIDLYDSQQKKVMFLQSTLDFLKRITPILSGLKKKIKGEWVKKLGGAFEQLRLLLLVMKEHIGDADYEVNKFTFLTFRVFHNLIYSGLCMPKKDENDEDQEEGSEEYDIGTGVGEGKGDNNATEKYDFEEQVLGEKGQEESEEDNDADSKDEDDASERDEEGGKEMDMENDFKGKNDEDKKKDEEEEKKKDEEEPDNEFSEVDEDQIDNDLWNQENEDMDESTEKEEGEEEERREAEEQEYKANQPQKDDTEQKAKEPKDREERKAEDYVPNQEPEEQEQDAEKMDEEGQEEEKSGDDEDEFAEVEDPSEMSNRNENQDMEFDSQEEEVKDGEEKEVDDLEIGEQESEADEEDQGESNLEEFEDPLNREERKMKEESKEEKDAELNEKAAEAGLNPQEAENEKKHEEEDEHETKHEKKQGKETQPKKQEKADEMENELEAEEKQAKEDDQKVEQKEKSSLKMDQKKLEEIVKEMMILDTKQSDAQDGDLDPDDVEGLEIVDDDQLDNTMVVSAPKQTNQPEKASTANQKKHNPVEVRREEEPKHQKPEQEEEGKEQDLLGKREREDSEDRQEGGQADQPDEEEEGVPPPVKKLKLPESQEAYRDQLVDKEHISEWAKLLNQDYTHISESNTSYASIEPLIRTRAYNLCEELRNILKPTKISGLKGDFRTGKRLNMRKVISYVASNYRKDKIWLRRANPNQRDYEIVLAIDDSLSMSEKNVGYLALESLLTMALALTKLEVGKINISGIRNGMHEVLGFDQTFVPSEGQRIVSQFNFKFSDEFSADMGLPNFMRQAMDKFSEESKTKICFIISDGRCNKEIVRPLCREAEEKNILMVYLMLDKKEEKGSVLNYRSTSFVEKDGKRVVRISNYLDDFPFKNYMIVQNVAELTGVLLAILRDYFARND